MSEAPAAALHDTSTTDLPLSVLLFHAAMNQEIAISEFAKQLGIGPLSLRQFISGQTQRPRSRTLEILAEALGMSVEDVRYRASLLPTSAPRFAEWLKSHMDGGNLSRARLTRETSISDGALRNYLSGQTLPDADQAQRLAQTLSVDPLEMAKVLVADQTVRSGGTTAPAPATEVEEAEGGAGSEYADALGSDGMMYDERFASRGPAPSEEERLLRLWRQLHPQGRRATFSYMADLLAEG
jgi:transcriptional regulator with XRE-family HTH domain